MLQPRLTAWYGDEGKTYVYSGIRNHPLPWTPLLLALKAKAEGFAESAFNSVLLNYYRDGGDSVGWHADNEPELGGRPVIASLSLGATRTFELRRRTTGKVAKLPLTSGSILVMRGTTQHNWVHRVPKEPGSASRINLTFSTDFPGNASDFRTMMKFPHRGQRSWRSNGHGLLARVESL